MPKIEALKTFTTIVEAGSLSEASRRLGLSKSVISARLAELEDELRARLVHRTARKLQLTDEGAEFYETARRIVLDLEEAVSAIAAKKDVLRGHLRISAPVSFGTLHLGPALHSFVAQHPDIELSLDLDDRWVDLASEGYDMAIRVGRLPDSSLVARKLVASRRVVVLARTLAVERGLPTTLADLERFDVVGYATRRVNDDWHFLEDGRLVAARVRSRIHFNNGVMQREAVAAGLGIAVLPTFIAAEAIADGRLVVAPLKAEPVEDAIYAIYPPNRHLSRKVRAMTDHLRVSFGDPPRWDALLMKAAAE